METIGAQVKTESLDSYSYQNVNIIDQGSMAEHFILPDIEKQDINIKTEPKEFIEYVMSPKAEPDLEPPCVDQLAADTIKVEPEELNPFLLISERRQKATLETSLIFDNPGKTCPEGYSGEKQVTSSLVKDAIEANSISSHTTTIGGNSNAGWQPYFWLLAPPPPIYLSNVLILQNGTPQEQQISTLPTGTPQEPPISTLPNGTSQEPPISTLSSGIPQRPLVSILRVKHEKQTESIMAGMDQEHQKSVFARKTHEVKPVSSISRQRMNTEYVSKFGWRKYPKQLEEQPIQLQKGVKTYTRRISAKTLDTTVSVLKPTTIVPPSIPNTLLTAVESSSPVQSKIQTATVGSPAIGDTSVATDGTTITGNSPASISGKKTPFAIDNLSIMTTGKATNMPEASINLPLLHTPLDYLDINQVSTYVQDIIQSNFCDTDTKTIEEIRHLALQQYRPTVMEKLWQGSQCQTENSIERQKSPELLEDGHLQLQTSQKSYEVKTMPKTATKTKEAVIGNSEKFKLLDVEVGVKRLDDKQCLTEHHEENLPLENHGQDYDNYTYISEMSGVDITSNEKPYRCNFCNKTFSRKNGVIAHLKLIHAGKAPYKCDQCEEDFNRKDHLTAHMMTHTTEKPFKCFQCNNTFSEKDELERHTMAQTGEKPFKCCQCEMAFSQKARLKDHQRTHTGEKPYKCSQCEKAFSNKATLKAHTNSHTKEISYKCTYCGKVFYWKGVLKTHVMTHTGEKPFKCNWCGWAFTLKFSLDNHIRTHTGERPHKCNHCGKAFTEIQQMRAHINSIHTKEKLYKCTRCEMVFYWKSSLRFHLQRHTRGKPYKCKVCQKEFSFKFSLKNHSHKHIHGRERLHNCSFCVRAFTSIYFLTRHMWTHTGEKPYKCCLCEKAFAVPQQLKFHLLAHTGGKPYKCIHQSETGFSLNACLKISHSSTVRPS